MHRILTRFRPYIVEHEYAGVRLKVHIADPLARGWYDHPWDFLPEVDLLQSSRLAPGARVFDLGAHQGVVAMILAHRVGLQGMVVAVEALPHNARMCEANKSTNRLPQILVEAAAISDQPGELDVAIDLNAQVRNRSSTITSIKIPATTVDDLVDKYGPPDVLFIDVEGYECHALRGATRALADYPDCYVEIHRGCGLELAGGTLTDIFNFFPLERYSLRAWSDADSVPRDIAAPSECPDGGRVFLVAISKGSMI